jgi:hypothetical protein
MSNRRRKKRKRAEDCRSTKLEGGLSLDTSASEVENGIKYFTNLMCEKKALQGFRSIGYTSNEAIADIIDNSIENNATNVELRINWNEEGAYGNLTSMVLIDNGGGMNENRLINALAIGSLTIDNSRFSKYGMGLITAPLSIARTITLLTRIKGGTVWKGVLDLDKLDEGRHRFVTKASAKETCLFEENIRGITGSPCGSGTVLIITNLDRIKAKTQTTFRREIEDHIGYSFRKLITSDEVCFYINGTLVSAIDPVCDPEIENKVTKVIHLEEGDITLNMVELKHGITYDSKKIRISHDNMGFHVLRNNRGIEGPKKYYMLKTVYDIPLFRCEICFGPELDDIFSLPIQKNTIIIPEEVKDFICDEIKPFLKVIRKNTKTLRQKGEEIIAGDNKVKNVLTPKKDDKTPVYSDKKLNKVIEAWKDLPGEVQKHIITIVEDCLASV